MSQSKSPSSRKSGISKRSASFWKAHVKAWQDSGLSRAEYCRRYKLSYHALTYWFDKARNTKTKPAVSSIVPVLSVQPLDHPAHTPIRIKFRQHFTIEINGEFDEVVLRKVIAALEG